MAVSASYVIINICNKAVYELDEGAYRVPKGTGGSEETLFRTLHCDFVASFSIIV